MNEPRKEEERKDDASSAREENRGWRGRGGYTDHRGNVSRGTWGENGGLCRNRDDDDDDEEEECERERGG